MAGEVRGAMQGHCVVSMLALKLLLSSGRLTLIVLRHFAVAFALFYAPLQLHFGPLHFVDIFQKTPLLMLILFEKLRAKIADVLD